ncbi:Dihydroorotate dehydrogenase B (NAD(+)), catalytic subunit [uncultured Desulfatiglans sp.]|uniref:Dihydroorotate dehydrogenase n=1 Tax=Uncultured Desulfatiglans sp. TaxID=1748965 RepID=A0A653AAR6_UNCDX|nr:Dihydroorotate dehydrogenase B (NAD(+)), catalytic subunit [uncultured Desulfatiglans sp.]
MGAEPVDMRVSLGPLQLKNPVVAASGTYGYGEEYAELVDPSLLGGIVVKGLSLKPREGNPPPRVVETPCGMLNAIGLANCGLDRFLAEKVPLLEALDTTVIVNIYGHRSAEYGALAKALRGVDAVDALEVNISCPNVECGGLAFGTDPLAAAKVTESVVRHADKPVIVKLSPNVTDIRVIARAVEAAGADALSLINTLTGMAVDVGTRRPLLGNVSGGLSGPAIKPVALYMLYQTVRAVHIPVMGMGGIMGARDALEFLITGATALQVGTAHFVDPRASIEIVAGIELYCRDHGIGRVADISGTLAV